MTPALITDRLLLRPFEHEDAAALALILGEASVAGAMCSVPLPFTRLHAAARILMARAGEAAGQSVHWAIEDRDGELAGLITLTRDLNEVVELGFAVSPACQRQGYACEALAAALSWTRRAGLARAVIARVAQDGQPAGGLLRKLGFAVSGTSPRWSEARNTIVAVHEWSLCLVAAPAGELASREQN